MEWEQLCDEFLALLAEDIQLSNPHLSVKEIKAFITGCKVWRHEWGAIFANGSDMHIHVLSRFRKKVFLRKPLREAAFFMFEQYPAIQTSIMKSKPDALAFDLKMGWKIARETSNAWYLTMKKEDFRYGKN